MGRLKDKVAIITGGARGQGAAEGKLFAREGANVVLTDILDEDGEKCADAIGGRFIHHDVTNEKAWENIVSEVIKSLGRIDVLINNKSAKILCNNTKNSVLDTRSRIATG